MDKIVLSADPRDATGKKASKLRQHGKLPAVVYGHGKASQSLTVDSKEFSHILASAGYSTILELKLAEGKALNVLIQDVAFDPVKTEPIHADFYQVKMDQTIRTPVPLHFIGESVAVFQQDGSLITSLEEVEIEALPGDLPQQIDVDISVLDDFEKTITVADLKIPVNVKLLSDEADLIAKVEPPRSDEELEALDEEVVENIPVEEGESTDEQAESDETK